MTTTSRFFDEAAKIVTGAAGAAQSLRKEVETLVHSQMERMMGKLDVVKREDFEVVREMAIRAREENEALARRIAELEAGKPATGAAHKKNHVEGKL